MRLALVAVLALGTGCSAFADEHEVWRCNTQNAHYDVNEFPIMESIGSVSGKIIFHKADLGPDWGSQAKIGFTDSRIEDPGCHCNGIGVKAFKGYDKVYFYMLVDGQWTEMARAPFEKPITFKFSVDPNGEMTAQIGKTNAQTMTAALPHAAHNRMMMSCSGADVSFLIADHAG